MNQPRSEVPDEQWIDDFAATVRQQRSRVREFLTAYRTREQSAQAHFASLMRRWQELVESRTLLRDASDAGPSLDVLQTERDALANQLADANAERGAMSVRMAALESLTTINQSADDSSESEFRRRHETTLDDLREAKAHNEDLEQQLRQRGRGGVASSNAPTKTLDWEAEKRRILAALEAEGDETEPQKRQRIEMEEVVRRTSRIIAQRDREIAELKQLLEDQSASLGSVAVGAAAVGAIFDQDAVICEERENLRRLEREWEEKLRKAEIEISIERAKLARERAELDDRHRGVQAHDGKPDEAGRSNSNTAKPTRGRWFSRLGLKDAEDDA